MVKNKTESVTKGIKKGMKEKCKKKVKKKEKQEMKSSDLLIQEIRRFVKERNSEVIKLEDEQPIESEEGLDSKEEINKNEIDTTMNIENTKEVKKEALNESLEKNSYSYDDFWGEGFDEILSTHIKNDYYDKSEFEIDIGANIDENKKENDYVTVNNRSSITRDNRMIENKDEFSTEKAKDQVSHGNQKVVNINNVSNQDITNEIQNIRRNYIVGKLAGEDLFDNKNNLIIKKNAVITASTIEDAERAGKLVELIVGMKLSERT